MPLPAILRQPPLGAYLTGLLVLVVVSATAVITVEHLDNVDDLRSVAGEQVRFRADLAATDLGDAVDAVSGAAARVAARPSTVAAVRDGVPLPSCDLTFAAVGPFPSGHIEVVDSSGGVICSSRELGRTFYGDAPWLGASPGERVAPRRFLDPTAGEVLLTVAPVEGGGAVVVGFGLDQLAERLARTLGQVLDVRFALVDDGAVDAAEATLLDGDRFVARAPVSGLGMSVLASVSEDSALAEAHERNRQLWVILAIGLLLVTAAAFAIHRAIARPISRLSTALRGMLAGSEVEMPRPVSAPHEVVTLSDDVSTLVRELRGQLDSTAAAERRYRTLFEANPHAMWVHHEDTGALLEVNEAMEERFGWRRDELRSMTLSELLPETGRAALVARLASDARVVRSGPWRLQTRAGDMLECLVSSEVIDLPGQRGRLVIAEDVTEELRAQRMLTRAERMESLGQLAGGIAHDFNNVLAAITNYTAFVVDEVQDASQDAPGRWQPVLEDLGRVEAAADRAVQLTQQLLSFARGEPVDPVAVEVNHVSRGVGEILERTLPGNIDLELGLDPETWPVFGEPSQVQQILLDLAINARDAMPRGGRLIIDTTNVWIDSSRDGEVPAGRYVRLRVSDDGVGMDPRVRDRAFDPFFTTKPPGKGTGLGLATVYGLVTGMGGSVSLYSEPGIGTTITVLLPGLFDPDEEAELEPEPRGAGPADATVLVVDDDDDLRDSAERILLASGYRVVTADSGEAALPLAHRVDAVLTDMVMPGMSGADLAARLRLTWPDLPIVFMSGYAEDLLTRASALGDIHLVEKPFTASTLTAATRQALRRR